MGVLLLVKLIIDYLQLELEYHGDHLVLRQQISYMSQKMVMTTILDYLRVMLKLQLVQQRQLLWMETPYM